MWLDGFTRQFVDVEALLQGGNHASLEALKVTKLDLRLGVVAEVDDHALSDAPTDIAVGVRVVGIIEGNQSQVSADRA